MQILGIRRACIFSPNAVHRDEAICQEVARCLHTAGHDVSLGLETALPPQAPAPIVFSMARSREALAQLAQWEKEGCVVINPTVGTRLAQQRARLVQTLGTHGIPQPTHYILNTKWTKIPPLLTFPCWVKRGDGCSETSLDVVFATDETALQNALIHFASRHITTAVVSAHVSGDLIKFYGVRGHGILHTYYATQAGSYSKFGWEVRNGTPRGITFDHSALATMMERTSELLQLPIYGGDAVVQPDGSLSLIDFNDWPSFAPCLTQAGEAIAQCILHSYKLHIS